MMDESWVDAINQITNSLRFLLPEGVLTGVLLSTIVIGLIHKKSSVLRWLAALVYAFMCYWYIREWPSNATELFSGMMRFDDFSTAFKILIVVGGIITIILSEEQSLQKAEYYTLLHAIVLGACLLSMSTNFISLILSIELISLSSYVLTGFNQQSKSAEGSLKYFLFGAVSTAIMIYGLSLLYGAAGTLYFTSEEFVTHLVNNSSPIFLLGGIMILAGLLFKISAVPFHLWTPDVYESAPTPVVAFFSVVPKLAGVAILAKLILAFHLFGQSTFDWQTILAVVAIATLVVGNLSALMQRNIKRMMAYSSIAQSGFILLGLASFTREGIQFTIFYSVAFLLANLAVFYSIQQFEQKEIFTFEGLNGKGRAFRVTGIVSVISLISLTGLPPTVGFTGKLLLFSGVWQTYQETGKLALLVLLMVALINTIVSLFFYLKIPFYLYLKPSIEDEPEKLNWVSLIFLLVAIALIALFLLPKVILDRISTINFII